MTTATKLITKAEVRSALRTLITTQPDRVNPMRENDPEVCSYIQGRGANIKRCIAGQIGYDFGLPTPKSGDDSVGVLTSPADGYLDAGRGLWAGRFTDGARKLLVAAQIVADGGFRDPLRWGDITLARLEAEAKVAYLPD